MQAVYILERLEKKGKSYPRPLFVYNLCGEWKTTTNLGKAVGQDGAEEREDHAQADALDIAEKMDWTVKVRKVILSLE